MIVFHENIEGACKRIAFRGLSTAFKHSMSGQDEKHGNVTNSLSYCDQFLRWLLASFKPHGAKFTILYLYPIY